MNVLGFDTATSSTVVGLKLADGSTLEARDDPRGEERPGHATRLLPLAFQLLSEAGLGWDAIARVAVGVGPGTFTGLRIGVATARGLTQSLGVELVGVSSLRALALPALVDPSEQAIDGSSLQALLARMDSSERTTEVSSLQALPARMDTPQRTTGVLAAIDARRGELFVAAYDGEGDLLAPQVLSPQAMEAFFAGAVSHTGCERWIAVGDGALRYRREFEQVEVVVPGDSSPLHQIQPRALCALGELELVSDAQVLPHYCRRPDAEIKLEGASV